jgi:hypothetical protein
MRHGLVLNLRVGAAGVTGKRPRCRNTPFSRRSPSLVQRRARWAVLAAPVHMIDGRLR